MQKDISSSPLSQNNLKTFHCPGNIPYVQNIPAALNRYHIMFTQRSSKQTLIYQRAIFLMLYSSSVISILGPDNTRCLCFTSGAYFNVLLNLCANTSHDERSSLCAWHLFLLRVQELCVTQGNTVCLNKHNHQTTEFRFCVSL